MTRFDPLGFDAACSPAASERRHELVRVTTSASPHRDRVGRPQVTKTRRAKTRRIEACRIEIFRIGSNRDARAPVLRAE
jgi:hypothetical protein